MFTASTPPAAQYREPSGNRYQTPVFITPGQTPVRILGVTRNYRAAQDNDGQIRLLPFLDAILRTENGDVYQVSTVNRTLRDGERSHGSSSITNQLTDWKRQDPLTGEFTPCDTLDPVWEAGCDLWYAAHELLETQEYSARLISGTTMDCVLCSTPIATPGPCICDLCQPIYAENAPGN